jgi:poly(3-hydroxybutyrate) depolymerase
VALLRRAIGAGLFGLLSVGSTRAWSGTPPPAHQPTYEIDLPGEPAAPALTLPAVTDALRQVSTQAEADVTTARALPAIPTDSADTLEWFLQGINKDVDAGNLDSCRVARLPEIAEAAAELAKGDDVVTAWRGATWRAYRSPLDGSLQPYAVYVPDDYDPTAHYPLVVELHGMNGSGMRSMAEMFGLTDDQGLSDEALACADPDVPSGREVLALGPTGFGNTFYRLEGDVDVMTVLDHVLAAYPAVDPTLVTITGPSMGGSGTAQLALEHPDRFAAMAPLVGYPDRRLDSWVADFHPELYYWESFTAEARSPTDWAANGLHVPLITMHGLRDDPRRSQHLIDAYTALGYEARGEWWDTGHFVQYLAYQGGRIFDELTPYRIDPNPADVVFRTPTLRFDGAYWLKILRSPTSSEWMSVEAHVDGPNHVTMTTDHITRLEASPRPPLVDPSTPLTLTVDGSAPIAVSYDGSRPLLLSRESGHWTASEEPPPASQPVAPSNDFPGAKRHGVSGPIEDIYYDPVVVVYGTHDPAERGTAWAVAKQMANRHYPVSVSYPVIADTDLDSDTLANHSVILVGSPANNSVLRRLLPWLPVKITATSVDVGTHSFTAPDTGIEMIYTNPKGPGHYLLVVSGISPKALELAMTLPDYVPDYIVYDGTIAAGDDMYHILATHLFDCAGYFTWAWTLSTNAGELPPPAAIWPPPRQY